MSGHNRWSSIKHKKGAVDAKRGKMFTKIIKEITVSARLGGGDPSGNPRLRHAIDEAKAANMPGENVTRAIKKGTGELEGVSYEEITYEGVGPSGALFLIEALTDNRNRTNPELRKVFERHNGALSTPGAAAWAFEGKGLVFLPKEAAEEEALFEAAVGAGADNVEDLGDRWMVTTERVALEDVKNAIAGAGLKGATAELSQLPKNKKTVEGRDAEVLMNLFHALEDHDDVQKVFSDFELSEAEIKRLSRMIVLGIDPGSIRTGWGVVRREGPTFVYVAAGTINAGKDTALPERLHEIHAELQRVIALHMPTTMAVEDIFHARFANSALKLGHARGVALLAGAQAGLSITAYPPALVKRSIAGRGQADKAQVARIVGAMLGLRSLPDLDATDALAIAITHAHACLAKRAAPIKGLIRPRV